MASEGSVSGRLARHAGGCLAYFLLFVALAWGVDAIVLAGADEDLRPWAGVAAAVFLTLGLGSLWGIVTGYAKWNPKGELLAATATGALPAGDGQVLATGTAKPAGLPLVSPISGKECVAYFYRMYHVPGGSDDGDEVTVYWGVASTPFVVESPRLAVRVRAFSTGKRGWLAATLSPFVFMATYAVLRPWTYWKGGPWTVVAILLVPMVATAIGTRVLYGAKVQKKG